MLSGAGSPPRMRGKQPDSLVFGKKNRITPADAGKTGTISITDDYVQDHPRGCGENAFPSSPTAVTEGSPPRMRGKLDIDEATGGRIGITPADAGKTLWQWSIVRDTRDHPRGCGENVIKKLVHVCPKWITPADAGKTLKRSFRNQPFCS